jgi:hypothetical protein
MHASPAPDARASWLAQRGAPILCASALLAAIGCLPGDGRPEGPPVPSSQPITAGPTYAPPPGLYSLTPSPDRNPYATRPGEDQPIPTYTFSVTQGTIEPEQPHGVYLTPPNGPSMTGEQLQRGVRWRPGEPPLPLPVRWLGATCGGAVPDASNRHLPYTTTEAGEVLPPTPHRPASREPARGLIPSLRRLDLQTGADTLLADLACGPAWSADGRLAYVQTVGPDTEEGWHFPLGYVMVQASPDSAAVPWTAEPQPLGGLVWANDRLLAQRGRPRPASPAQDLVALDGSGAVQVLAAGATLIALSPDGTRALVTTPQTSLPEYAASLIRVADGALLAYEPLPPWQAPNLAANATWVENRVFATVGRAPAYASSAPPWPTIVVIAVADDHIEIEHVISMRRSEIDGLT